MKLKSLSLVFVVVLNSSCGSESKSKGGENAKAPAVEAKPTAPKGEITAELFTSNKTLKSQLQGTTQILAKAGAQGSIELNSLKPDDMQAGGSGFSLSEISPQAQVPLEGETVNDGTNYAQRIQECVKRTPEATEDKDADGIPAIQTTTATCKDIVYKYNTSGFKIDYKFSMSGVGEKKDLDETKKGLIGGVQITQKDLLNETEFTIEYDGKSSTGQSKSVQNSELNTSFDGASNTYKSAFKGDFSFEYKPFNLVTGGQAQNAEGAKPEEIVFKGSSKIWNDSSTVFEQAPVEGIFNPSGGFFNSNNIKEVSFKGYYKFDFEGKEKAAFVFDYSGDKLAFGGANCQRFYKSGTITYSAAKGSVVYEYTCDKVTVKIDGKEVSSY